jgi:hypothetical protein
VFRRGPSAVGGRRPEPGAFLLTPAMLSNRDLPAVTAAICPCGGVTRFQALDQRQRMQLITVFAQVRDARRGP